MQSSIMPRSKKRRCRPSAPSCALSCSRASSMARVRAPTCGGGQSERPPELAQRPCGKAGSAPTAAERGDAEAINTTAVDAGPGARCCVQPTIPAQTGIRSVGGDAPTQEMPAHMYA